MAPNDVDILVEFGEFVEERRNAGVVLAHAVKDLALANGSLLVTVSPEEAGFLTHAAYSTSAFNNFADLFGVPLAFDNEQGHRLRQTVQRVTVIHVDGTTLGTRTSLELFRSGTGKDLPWIE